MSAIITPNGKMQVQTIEAPPEDWGDLKQPMPTGKQLQWRKVGDGPREYRMREAVIVHGKPYLADWQYLKRADEAEG